MMMWNISNSFYHSNQGIIPTYTSSLIIHTQSFAFIHIPSMLRKPLIIQIYAFSSYRLQINGDMFTYGVTVHCPLISFKKT